MKPPLLACAALAALICQGCGSSGPQPVRGVVLLDGAPLANACVTFLPKDGAGRPAFAYTADDGAFELNTLTAGDGAMPGEYKILVSKTEVVKGAKRQLAPGEIVGPEGEIPVTANRVHASYNDEQTTPFSAKVPCGRLSLELKSTGP